MFINAHLVGFSVYPFLLGLILFGVFLSIIVFLKTGLFFFVCLNLIFFFYVMFLWVKDVLMESMSGYHNYVVDKGFKKGFVLFLFTEVMFFFGIFWFFFDKVYFGEFFWWLGCYLDFFGLPFFGTVILLSSGVLSTISHNKFLGGGGFGFSLLCTLFLGLMFILLQFYEYSVMMFNMSDGVAASLFFFLTGFHGFHVILGVFMLVLSGWRLFFFFGVNFYFFEASIIYWHFVDVVWLLLYVIIYF